MNHTMNEVDRHGHPTGKTLVYEPAPFASSSDCSALVAALENMNLHITALASCGSVAASLARLAAEKERSALVAALVGKAQNKGVRVDE